ncbi:Na(+)/H(+) antiporter NhaB [Pseudoalteromonas sp. NBT06-2]|uniref:sodium/proton antiporter NhaB n=1 Tax=Pseudoalteromonas sp. NBT06-2 TaxID=2025950 RepID=UPI000BA65D86|nr:sodium/proton antiporter NhaB [Pseudoalteromonas sp. NBT06-2]PAJ73034.1 Na(+)/H(+) antiporter NhaB [Pseudoalteromonas sp. NBT06-2]
MPQKFANTLFHNFLGSAPQWYKLTIITFLIFNPILFMLSPYIAGWVLVLEFIFTLAMALKCYPLQPGGLLAIEAVAIGMTTPHQIEHELAANLEVILLLIFMVAGIYFIKNLLLFAFTKMLTKVKSKIILSLLFCASSAFLSAFLDALTVIAVVISVGIGFYSVYHKVASNKSFLEDGHDHTSDHELTEFSQNDLKQFRGFLRNIMMHAGVGTALGGAMTLVGEPQNLIIGSKAGWEFVEYAIRMSPVTIPVFIAGLFTCFLVEKFSWFNYGVKLPVNVRETLVEFSQHEDDSRSYKDNVKLIAQGCVAIWLIAGLALQLAPVGLMGLSVIILASAFTSVIDEHAIGKAFQEALPFTALLVVFFAIVAVIIDQQLFTPVIHWVLTFDGNMQLVMFYLANGLLSMVSDNVFVGTVYINEVAAALQSGQITRAQFDMLAVTINTGTNLPSVATPNGQAAFLFLLTSALAPLIRLSYGRMVIAALPYTIVLTFVGLIMIYSGVLTSVTETFYQNHWIEHQNVSSNTPAKH